jgi:hypothetical protein
MWSIGQCKDADIMDATWNIGMQKGRLLNIRCATIESPIAKHHKIKHGSTV